MTIAMNNNNLLNLNTEWDFNVQKMPYIQEEIDPEIFEFLQYLNEDAFFTQEYPANSVKNDISTLEKESSINNVSNHASLEKPQKETQNGNTTIQNVSIQNVNNNYNRFNQKRSFSTMSMENSFQNNLTLSNNQMSNKQHRLNTYKTSPAAIIVKIEKKQNQSSTTPIKIEEPASTNVQLVKEEAGVSIIEGNDLQIQPARSNGRLTAMEIFQKYIKYYKDVESNLYVDVSSIISRSCYVEWLASRKKIPARPEETFRKSILCHCTSSDGGSAPFPPEVEFALLKLLRRPGKVWPCFDGYLDKNGKPIRIGLKGLRATGYHEKKKQEMNKLQVNNTE